MSFSSDIAKFAAKTEGNVDKLRRGVFQNLAGNIIEATPIKTGRAAGNWQATVNTPATGTVTNTSPTAAVAAAQAASQAAKEDSTLWLINNLPYIKRLEYGYSKQAPQGMLRLAVQNFQAAIDKQLRLLDK